jgi:hypothetical protein
MKKLIFFLSFFSLAASVFAQFHQPQFKWDSDTINCSFDMYHKSDTVLFSFTNTGKSSLHISRCYSKDTVLTILYFTENSIPPGERGYIKAICTPRYNLRWRPVSCPGGRGVTVHATFSSVLNVVLDGVPALQLLVVKGDATTHGCQGPLRGGPYHPPPGPRPPRVDPPR